MCCLLLNLVLQEYGGYQNWLTLTLRLDIGQVGFTEMQMDCLECQWILRFWILDLCTEETSQEFIKATINAVQLQDKNLCNWVTSFATYPDVLDFDTVHKAQNATSRKEQCQFETIDILQAQLDDKSIQRVVELKKSNSKPDSQQRSLKSKETRLFLYEWDKLQFCPEGILMRQCVNKSQVILPPICFTSFGSPRIA